MRLSKYAWVSANFRAENHHDGASMRLARGFIRDRDRLRRSVVRVMVGVPLLAGVAAIPASAEPVRCKQVVDQGGDARESVPPSFTPVGPNEPDADIVSGDIASNGKSVTTVVRVAHLGSALEAAPRRLVYQFFFRFGKYDVATLAFRSVDGETFRVSADNPETHDATGASPDMPAEGVFDVAHNEVRVTIPLLTATAGRSPKPGAVFDQLVIQVTRGVGLNSSGGASAGEILDSARSTARYPAGSATCVRVGK